MNQREEAYRRKLERETERRRRAEEQLLLVQSRGTGRSDDCDGGIGRQPIGGQPPPGARALMLGGPDYEVGDFKYTAKCY